MKNVSRLINEPFPFITYAFISIYTLAVLAVCLNRFWQYQYFYFDFGIFDSAIWKLSRFQLPFVDHVDFSTKNIIIFGDHFNPSLVFIAPFYWLTGRSEILIVVQTFAVSLSAVVAYKIAKRFINNELIIFSLIFAYLGYVGLQNALISDFHESTIAVLPLMLVFWSIVNEKWRYFFLFLILLLGFKESFTGLGVGIGFFILLQGKKNIRYAFATMLVSVVWGYLTIGFIIPFLSGEYLYTPKEIPNSLSAVITALVEPDLKWKTVVYSFLTFGFLPLFDIAVLPAIAENFFERFILTEGKGNDLGMHYNATLAPLLFIGALNTFIVLRKYERYIKLTPILAVIVILTVLVLHRFVLRGPLGLAYNPVFYEQTSRVEYVNRLIEQSPKNGRIMTQNDLAVRFTHYNVKLLREDYKEINPDHVILNLTEGQNPNSFFPLTFEKAKTLKDDLLHNVNYRVTKYGDEVYVFSKQSL